MRLTRIEARSFGALRDCTLDGLGDGLTIVRGPNESGKSTYMALVRQVLYGYPGKRDPEYRYRPSAGREGRLVFADEAGEWAITRTEGTYGGPVQVEALRGADRPRVREEVVGNITERTFRVVFGFGLDELADIERGEDQDVVARLFAGAFGLGVNPLDARKKLEEAAGACFKNRGAGVLNVALDKMREEKAHIKELEGGASAYAEQQGQLKTLEKHLGPLTDERDGLSARLRAVENDLVRARGLADTVREVNERLEQVKLDRDQAQRDEAHTVVDTRLLEIAAEIETSLSEESGARQHEDRARQLDARASQLRTSIAASGVPDGVADSPEARARLEEWRARKARLESDVESAQRVQEAKEAQARGMSQVLSASAAPSSAKRVPAAALAALLAGTAAIVAGYLMAQWVATVLGAAVAIAGILMLVVRPKAGSGRDAISEERMRFEAESATAAELARAAQVRLETESRDWEVYLSQRLLDSRGSDPAAVTGLLDAARERDGLIRQAVSIEAEALLEREAAREWARRLTELVRPRLGIADASPEPHALAIRAREALQRARDARQRRDEAARAVQQADIDLERLEQSRERAAGELAAIAAAHGIEGDPVVRLEQMAADLDRDLGVAAAVLEEQTRSYAELKGRLDTLGVEDELALARQRLEGFRARAESAATSYVVESVALKLVDRARERFERERQPEVVRTAARVFAKMTDGRFSAVRVPLGGEAIAVVTEKGDVMYTPQLSRGTAEQLYLALRVGLIESFGEQGPHLPVLMDDIVVNYDVDRVRGAAAAIAELASSRQVVFFTCHEATADILSHAVSGARTIELDRCAL